MGTESPATSGDVVPPGAGKEVVTVESIGQHGGSYSAEKGSVQA